jgi:hypothetical protein
LPYPLKDDSIQEWAESINESLPGLEVEELREVMEKFKTGELDFDPRLMIRNIFIGLRMNKSKGTIF